MSVGHAAESVSVLFVEKKNLLRLPRNSATLHELLNRNYLAKDVQGLIYKVSS